MVADASRVIENLESLRTLTGDVMGAQRVAWTPAWLKARAWFTALVEALPHQESIAGQPSGFGAERRLAGWMSRRVGGV
jgi:hypothetical protein